MSINLFSLITKVCPNGTEYIDIKSEIEKYKREQRRNGNHNKPVIIIDVASICTLIYTNKKAKLLGGEFNVYNEQIEHLYQQLKELDLDIISVINGSLNVIKIDQILKKNQNRYFEQYSIIQQIEDLNFSHKGTKFDYFNHNDIAAFFYNIKFLANKYGKTIISHRDFQQEIAFQANQYEALAIISYSQKFLIFEGEWQFWSGPHISLKNLTVLRYNRVALRTFLNLSSSQMILFATICGNEIVEYGKMNNFYKNILRSTLNTERGCKVADYVRIFSFSSPQLTKSDEDKLVCLLYGRDTSQYEMERQKLQKSIEYFYSVSNVVEFKSELLRMAANSTFVYSMLENLPFKIHIEYFDFTETTFTPYYELIKPVILRQLGTLLKSYGEENIDTTRIFITKLSHETPFVSIMEKPIYPQDELPPLEDLVVKRCMQSNYYADNNYALRLKLFWWQLLPDFDNSFLTVMETIPSDIVLTLATLKFMVKANQISVSEADSILLACFPDKLKNELQLEEPQIDKITKRNALIAFLFLNLYEICAQSVEVVGLDIFKSLITFNGIYFHYIRNQDKNEFVNEMMTAINIPNAFRIYAKN